MPDRHCLFRRLIRYAFAALWLAAVAPSALAQTENRYAEADAAYARKDYAAAHRLWLEIAEEGNASAYFNLGRLYVFGEGVPIDPIEAYAWFTLADQLGLPEAKSGLNRVGRLMTPEEVEEGKRRIDRWFEAHPNLRR